MEAIQRRSRHILRLTCSSYDGRAETIRAHVEGERLVLNPGYAKQETCIGRKSSIGRGVHTAYFRSSAAGTCTAQRGCWNYRRITRRPLIARGLGDLKCECRSPVAQASLQN